MKPPVERIYPPKIAVRVANPLLRRALKRPGARAARGLMLLRFRGRKTGRVMETPVARQDIDGRLACLTNSGWRHNFRGGHDCEIYLDGTLRTARGELVTDVDRVARVYLDKMQALGPRNYRRTGLRVNVSRGPTLDDLTEAVRRYGLSYVTFTVGDGTP